MAGSIQVSGMEIRVVRKEIRNLHLSVLPPDGRVRISAPEWMDTEAIRLFAIDKLGWIKRQREKMHAQERESPRVYIERESHYLWGQRYLLNLVEHEGRPVIEVRHRKLVMKVRQASSRDDREALMYAWYRAQIRQALPELLDLWVGRVGVAAPRVHIQRMKTRWGSCNPVLGSIRLNTELAKLPMDCLEYILVHEMVHLREPDHGPRFVAAMDRLLPSWHERRAALSRGPTRYT